MTPSGAGGLQSTTISLKPPRTGRIPAWDRCNSYIPRVPDAAMLALLVNPRYPSAESEIRETQAAAHAVGRNLIVLNASTEAEIDAAFAELGRRRVGGLIVTGDPFFVSRRDEL